MIFRRLNPLERIRERGYDANQEQIRGPLSARANVGFYVGMNNLA